MSNIKLREQAITLRKQYKSYSQIKKKLNIPKSTLSYWLHDLPLPSDKIKELRDNNEIRIEKFRTTMKKKRENRLNKIYHSEKVKINPFTKRDLLMAGLALYWGEGSKVDWSKVAITNTDPNIIIFFINWLEKIFGVKKNKMKVVLQLYNDMDIIKEINYWSKTIKIPKKQFIKPYIKNTKSMRVNHKGSFGHGTCAIMIYSVILKEKIMMQLKLLAELSK